MFAALAVPAFRAFLLSMVFSYIPMQMMQVVRGYLAFTMTGSAAAVRFVQTAWGAPQIFVILVAGVIADRFERNRIIAITRDSSACSGPSSPP